MSNVGDVANILGATWFALWIAVVFLCQKLYRALRQADLPQLGRLQREQGTLDPREPFRAYWRLRSFVRDRSLRQSYGGRLASIMERLAWLLACLEILTAILLPLTLFAGLRGVLGEFL